MLEQGLQRVIRDRNDAVRRLGLNPRVTPGIRGLAAIGRVLDMVRGYDDFGPDNDPYGEHDFGSFELNGFKIFWKIDYYDENLKYWSDPLDGNTKRVLTVMLAEEY